MRWIHPFRIVITYLGRPKKLSWRIHYRTGVEMARERDERKIKVTKCGKGTMTGGDDDKAR